LQEAFAALMLYYAHGDVIDTKPAFGIFPEQTSNLTSFRDQCPAPATRRIDIGGKLG